MNAYTLSLRTRCPLSHRKPIKALDEDVLCGFRFKRVSEVKFLGISVKYRPLLVNATGKNKNRDNPSSSGNNEPPFPEDDIPETVDPVHEKPHSLVDWRDFRASLVAHKHALLDTDTPDRLTSHKTPHIKLGQKWAHPLPIPEPGCVLVATEKLDGVSSFERAVVLLLKLGTRDPREGPFGVIINRPLHKKIKNTSPSNVDLANTFAECPVYFGGPLDTSMFLVRNDDKLWIPGLEVVVPGVCFGARNSLEGAAELVKKRVLEAEDFKFFVGYAGWQYDQLREEINSGYWVVAACSSYLIGGGAVMDSSSPTGLWEEILQLMGGRYTEMSRKPRKDKY